MMQQDKLSIESNCGNEYHIYGESYSLFMIFHTIFSYTSQGLILQDNLPPFVALPAITVTEWELWELDPRGHDWRVRVTF